MCGIVGAVTRRQASPILLEGLKRLEYRGYDSAGMAILDPEKGIDCLKRSGKVAALEEALAAHPLRGCTGIAHTRWATHGQPSQINAHPHVSGGRVAVVHNGIIENFSDLKERLERDGYEFLSQTDTEVIVHLINQQLAATGDLRSAVMRTIDLLEGAYGIAVMAVDEPEKLFVARSGSPLVLGIGLGENFIASDQLALRQVTDRFVYLEEGDIAEVTPDDYTIHDARGELVHRPMERVEGSVEAANKGAYRHFMLKEIYEQADVVRQTLHGRVGGRRLLEESFGSQASQLLDQVEAVQIVACGTSYHAGLVAKYWIEDIGNVPCRVEVASEFRYRRFVVQPDTLLVTISQSGETADTLAALRQAKTLGYTATMAICNVALSSLVRESDIALLTHAGPEIGVASTKAFTTQLTALSLLTLALGRRHGLSVEDENTCIQAIRQLPELITETLALDGAVQRMAESFAEKHHTLFLGRGVQYPVAMEGSLKLKEISYIHAEAYPAGELKHGPLALVDDDMPVVAVAPNDELLEKLKSNLQEVRARGGQLYVFADKQAGFSNEEGISVIDLPHVPDFVAPLVYTIPLQLLSYYVAVLKGTDVDQPRNLAKSVTVE